MVSRTCENWRALPTYEYHLCQRALRISAPRRLNSRWMSGSSVRHIMYEPETTIAIACGCFASRASAFCWMLPRAVTAAVVASRQSARGCSAALSSTRHTLSLRYKLRGVSSPSSRKIGSPSASSGGRKSSMPTYSELGSVKKRSPAVSSSALFIARRIMKMASNVAVTSNCSTGPSLLSAESARSIWIWSCSRELIYEPRVR
mmetsp:Transcript_1873/g.3978  ORF Transcript_1873/g.3978 Transcript_1873/m.3978 type:complete len:203 (-) Transcript_1873:357-965(-)